MSRKEISLVCPCCESRIELDVRTEKIVSWRRAEELDPTGKPVVRESDWDQAHERVRGREGAAVDKFDQALSKEKTRGRDLDDLFDKLKDEPGDEDA